MTTRYRMIVPAIRMAVPPGMQMCRRCANVATAQPDGLSCVCDAHANTVRQMIGRAEVDGQPPAEDRPPRRRGSRTPHGRTGVSLLIPDIGLTDVACVHARLALTVYRLRRGSRRRGRRVWSAEVAATIDAVTVPFASGRIAIDAEFPNTHDWRPMESEYWIVVRTNHNITVRSVVRRPLVMMVVA